MDYVNFSVLDLICFFYTACVQYRNALCLKHGIRPCCVRIDRLDYTKIPTRTPRTKKLLSTRKIGSVRKQVSWLPDKSSTEMNSAAAILHLGAYQDNAILSASGSITRNRTFISLFLSLTILKTRIINYSRLLVTIFYL